MSLLPGGISEYIEAHTTMAGGMYSKIERETYLKSVYPRMLSGNLQGRFIAMVSRLLRPAKILEIGTFTGYSALCLCEGLAPDGRLHTIEINEELRSQHLAYFKEAGQDGVITTHYGNALDILPTLDGDFDLIFIDADKVNYCSYYELGLAKLRLGGFMLADNVLWSGKVLMEKDEKIDKDTRAVKDFNELVQNDYRVENVMIPLRDGMSLIQKIC
ncbi:MAG: methyltransferase [Cyclobacteriaceae bacterium]|nr:methyltransferase [Cyclobacteriaceae bacterium]